MASDEVVGTKTDWSSLTLESADKKESSEISGERERAPPTGRAHTLPVTSLLRCPSTEETLNFWKGIADVGLLGEVVPNISAELLELLNSVKQRNEATAGQEAGAETTPRSNVFSSHRLF